MLSVVVITSGQRKFTHWNMKVKMPSTTIAGFISGSTILRKIWNSRRAVEPRRLDEAFGQRRHELAHHEDAERAADHRQDHARDRC